jgi:hypothetical protein
MTDSNLFVLCAGSEILAIGAEADASYVKIALLPGALIHKHAGEQIKINC